MRKHQPLAILELLSIMCVPVEHSLMVPWLNALSCNAVRFLFYVHSTTLLDLPSSSCLDQHVQANRYESLHRNRSDIAPVHCQFSLYIHSGA